MSKTAFIVASFILISICPAIASGQITRSFTEPVEVRLVAANQPDVVTQVVVSEGSLVSAGDIIAELDNSVLKKQLQIAKLRANSEAAIKASKVEMESSEKRMEQLSAMLDKGHANPAEVEKAESEFKSAEAELELAKEKKKEYQLDVERIDAEIERNVIRSPIDGIVTEIHVKPGEFIASNERKIATVVCLEQLRVHFYLLETTTSRLSAGQNVELLVGADQDKVAGKLEFVSPVIDPDSGTSRVDVVLENTQGKLRAGSICYWPGNESGDSVSIRKPHALDQVVTLNNKVQ